MMDKLVLFDIDKTLIVGSRFHYNALKKALTQVYGVENPKSLTNMQGMTDLKIICATLQSENIPVKTIKSGLDECMRTMCKNFKDALEISDLKVLKGVNPLLQEMKEQGIPMGLVTGNMEAIAWLKLDKVNLKQYFQFGGFGDRVLKRSGLVEKALEASNELIGSVDRNNVYLVGDTPRDIWGGMKAEVNTLGVATGDFTEYELMDSGADYVVKDLTEKDRIFSIILDEKPV
jgi:phosphoglycolate phosphatase